MGERKEQGRLIWMFGWPGASLGGISRGGGWEEKVGQASAGGWGDVTQ